MLKATWHRFLHAIRMQPVHIMTLWSHGEFHTFAKCAICGKVSR